MKLKQLTAIFFLLTFLLSACSEEETPSCTVNVQVEFPEEYATLPLDGVTVTLTNRAGRTAYTSLCSPAGVAAFNVEPGDYAASVHHQTATGLVFNGRIESLSLLPDGAASPLTVQLTLTRAKTHALVIKEIYYGGCVGRAGEEYMDDQYITLYNNSDETVYLDGLCVAEVDFCFGEESPWMQRDPNMPRIPVGYFTWQFPGNGQDYPLLPGAETTIAPNAVNHTGGEYGHLNSVDLSTVDWGFYKEGLKNEITPGVNPLEMILRVGTEIEFGFSLWGPTVMLFSLPVPDGQAYVADPANREISPDEYGIPTEKFLMIPKEWVIDCIECGFDWKGSPLKRVPAELDSEAINIPGGFSGNYQSKSLVRRKSIAADGRITYQDTNNSAQDLEVSTPLLKR